MSHYMNEVFVGAADDVVVGDGDGVDAAATSLQDMDTFERADVPDLTDEERKRESERSTVNRKRDAHRLSSPRQHITSFVY